MLAGRPIWLVCDHPEEVPTGLFDHVSAHPEPQCTYRDKILAMGTLPFTRTLFLDTDVELLQPVEDLFRLLEAVDLVGCHAPVRWAQWADPQVPEGFCELNSGVLGLCRSPRVRRLIRTWLTTYDQAGVPFDQAALRSALWQGCQRGLRLWVLPAEYNLRTTKPWIAGKRMAVKIVHGRIPEAMRKPLAHYLNDNIEAFRASSVFPTNQNAGVLEPDPSLLALPVASAPPLPAGDLAGACRRLFVLGAGRSGTSLLAGLFRHSGLFMGDAAYRSRAANPHGFFEDREVNAINEALLAPLLPPPAAADAAIGRDALTEGQRWLARLPLASRPQATPELQQRIEALYARGPSCFKDPRFCHTLSAWRQLLSEDDQEQSAYLCVFRHPAVVLASVLQEVHSAPYLQPLAISTAQALESWCSHYRHVLEHHAGSGRWLFLAYEQLLEPAGLERVEAFTGHAVDRRLPQASLNRSRLNADLQLPEAVLTIYRELCARAEVSPQL